jgi:hypothetical protein
MTTWAASETARRAVVHAARTLHHAGALGGLLHESGLHSVRVAFHAALVLFAFVALAPRRPMSDGDGAGPIDLLSCEVATFAVEGAGQRVAVAGLLDGVGTRRLDAMSLLLTSASLCARATTFGFGAVMGETLTVLASDGL